MNISFRKKTGGEYDKTKFKIPDTLCTGLACTGNSLRLLLKFSEIRQPLPPVPASKAAQKITVAYNGDNAVKSDVLYFLFIDVK